MDTQTTEAPSYLYERLGPLGEDCPDELPPSPSEYAFTNVGLHGTSQATIDVSSSTLTTTELHSGTTSPPVVVLEEIVTEEFQGRVQTTWASPRHDQEFEEDGETDLSERHIEGAPLASTSKDKELDFLSLDVDDLGVTSLEAQAVQVEEEKVIISEIRSSLVREAPPWARLGRFNDSYFRSPFLQLHQEIVDFCNFVAPTKEEQLLRAAAVQRVSEVVKSIWPSCQVKVFGSFATGLFLPTSDCDVVILESGCQVPQDGLKAIAKALNRKSLVKRLQVIGKARVPIVKFVEIESNISFDISFDVANGPDAAEFIRDAMAALPPLRPLCLVLKIFLQQRELNEVYTGGIGSYALLVMLLTHLQMHPSRRNMSNRGEPCSLESNLGVLLVDFFDFYGRALNVRDVGISCRSGGRFYSKSSRGFLDSGRPYLLSVEDPQSPDNDIGKNSYNVTKVRSAFLLAHRLLTKLEVEDVSASVGLLGRIVRMDEQLTRRKATLPELPRGLNSKIKFSTTGPSTGNSSSNPFSSEPEMGVPRVRSGAPWEVFEDDDFPRGGGEPDTEQKPTHKRKHRKSRTDSGLVDGDYRNPHYRSKRKRDDYERGGSDKGLDHGGSHISHQHKRAKEDLEQGGSSSGSGRRSMNSRNLASPTVAGSPSRNVSRVHGHGRVMPGSSNGNIVKHENLGKGRITEHVDVLPGHRMSDGKRNRWRRPDGLGKDPLEDENADLKDDGVTSLVDRSQDGEGSELGAGNGRNKHRRRFSEGRPQKTPRVQPERRGWTPGGDEGAGRSSRRLVITKPSHKKIKYL